MVSCRWPSHTVCRFELRHMHTREELFACFPVISQLRHRLGDAASWVMRAMDMKVEGYRVFAACAGPRVVAVAGYRVMENLRHGRLLYVDDLVTAADARGEGIGTAILDALADIGRDECCERMIVNAAKANTSAHRFLKREGLKDLTVGFIKSLETTP